MASAADSGTNNSVKSYAIVAIPSHGSVWGLSSEKVPHLTLLFLGDKLDNFPQVRQFVKHVVHTSLRPFDLEVTRRGILGDKSADVLFFGDWYIDRLEQARGYLLTNPDIRRAYDSIEQFPSWVPHLTLGYPETPAKTSARDPDDPGTLTVDFDRIALWTGDYDGVEFLLKDDNDLSMTSVRGEEFLEHYGVKGMKWGVHNEDVAGGIRPLQGSSSLTIDSKVPKSTQTAAKEVASLVDKRYGFHISDVKIMDADPSTPGWVPDMIGYVQEGARGQGAVIHVGNKDPSRQLKKDEATGWLGKGCGNTKAFLTHEAAHAIFHNEQKVKSGFLGPKIVGGNIKARDKAIRVAVKAAQKEGIPPHLFVSKISGYAESAGNREEMEAELFSQYHWNPNPPTYVREWGETLHKEMGIDDTPFREGG